MVKECQKARSSIGFVTTDERSFYWRLSGRENLQFFATLHNLPQTQVKARVEELLDVVHLKNRADEPFLNYSAGMKQRMANCQRASQRSQDPLHGRADQKPGPGRGQKFEGLHQGAHREIEGQDRLHIHPSTGFVGLVAPHMARMVIGRGNRFLKPASGVLGALVLMSADAVGMNLIAPTIIPTGIMTSIVGVPFFMYPMMKGKRKEFWT